MSRTWVAGMALAAGAAAMAASARAADERADVVLRGVAIVDVVGGRVTGRRDIVVRGTRIAEIRPASAAATPAKATLEGAGKFVLPGLVDPGASGPALAEGRAAQALLSWGITAIDGPTLDEGARARWRRDLNDGRFYGPRLAAPCRAGRGVAAASAPEAPDALHDALARLVDRGTSPAQALRTFAHDNALALCLEADGVVAPGRPADLLVLTGNPLDDIRHTRALDAVVFRGELLSQAHLQMLRRGGLTPPTPSMAR